MAAYSPLSDSFNPHLLSSPIAPKTSTDIHTPVKTSRLSQSSNTKRNPEGRGSWARVGSPGGSRVLGGIQVSTTELFSKEGSEQSKCFAASVVVVVGCLSILYELEKLSLKLLLLLLLLLLQKKTKRRLDSESSKHTEELTQKNKKKTNKALQLLLGFLNSACKEKVSQIAAVATSSSSSSAAAAAEE